MNVPRLGSGEHSRPLTLRLSIARRVVCDLVHFAHKVPTVPVQRVVDASRVAAARERLRVRVGWAAIFTKALSLVARKMPELRRAYVDLPVARLYQHPHSVASVAVEREYEGELGVFFAYIPQTEKMPLPELEATLRRYKEAPVEDVFGFSVRFYRMPRLIRRFLWWYILNFRGARKAQFLGTFGVSVYSSLGAESLHPLSPLSTTLNYGVIGADGRVPVRIVYDHRVMDGAMVARALEELENVLNAEILQELTTLLGSGAAAGPLPTVIPPSPVPAEPPGPARSPST
jgi:hypothetical protein